MRLQFRVRTSGWSGEIQREVERSIEFAVDRYNDRIDRISVYLTDLKRSRGPRVLLCQMTAILKGAKPALILQRGQDVISTVNRAARRLNYHIGKNINRARMPDAKEYRATVRAA